MDVIETLQIFHPSIDDEELAAYQSLCEADFIDYTKLESVPDGAAPLICDMCEVRISKNNALGLSSESAGGSSISYTDGYPADIQARLDKYLVRTVKVY